MAKLKVGDKAPGFSGSDRNGKPVVLEDYKGKTIVLYFYPKDSTPGCTAESCNFRDNYATLTNKGFEVIGVSVDSEKSHDKFADKYNLPFTLIADTHKKMVEDYGVWTEKSMFGKAYMGIARTTFIIDGNGMITHIIDKVDTKNSTQQVLDVIG
ncbi:thioredoxin-dependent thiol peroxidase [Solitalea lacus]|uniref:thioredoxin-dependent thiol peroxidase n=1 Tax=Solitalea lacus TaxID=2911172 RepID=UPI001EDA990B|nr:thioredoxin-dependent thiol peroxidase [Solitalea lacus]UKJ08846.1 thioredoxin-dependent thiol peroxidase [Solitalea lacus]